ncbi:hypothetical protein SAMN05216356_10999 [Oribacterium sp. WCC10]|nr:hypothetical protein SAMN05216356_10999 [Oribacterium sp. WCC10]
MAGTRKLSPLTDGTQHSSFYIYIIYNSPPSE